MQSLNKNQLWIALWWKKYEKIAFLYLILFFVIYYFSSNTWVTGKPVSMAEEIIKRFTSYDFSRSYRGIDLMGSYIWLYILPFIFSLFLFNSKSLLILLVFVQTIVSLKIYNTYIELNESIPFKSYLEPYIKIEYKTDIYLYALIAFCFFAVNLSSIVISLLKNKKQ
jgi:hypothetical protein